MTARPAPDLFAERDAFGLPTITAPVRTAKVMPLNPSGIAILPDRMRTVRLRDRDQFSFRSGSSSSFSGGNSCGCPRVSSHRLSGITCGTSAKLCTVSTSTCSFGLP